MKIAIFGDIYGNFEAFHAAYNAIHKNVEED
jgi:hypothetical protein